MAEEIYLTQYGLMAERHWREFRPRMVQEMEAKGTLMEALFEAQETTINEMEALTRQLETEQKLTPQQAHDQAWEMIREKYILLPPEENWLNARNYRIRAEDRLGDGSLKQKCRDNFAAIELVQRLDLESRPATDDEKRILVKYVGWGGIPQVFASPLSNEWKAEGERLKELLAQRGIRGGARLNSERALHLRARYFSDLRGGSADRLHARSRSGACARQRKLLRPHARGHERPLATNRHRDRSV